MVPYTASFTGLLMKKGIGIWLFVISSLCLSAQKQVEWIDLSHMTFTERYDDALGSYIRVAEFDQSIRALEGKEVIIKGFMIPVDVTDGLYVLSANQFAACFFCGQAGPETVMELEFKSKSKRFKTDEYVVLKGILVLNEDDVYKLNYILKNAELVK